MSSSGLSELFTRAQGKAVPLVGLRTIQDVVDQHGGRLWVESPRGAETSIFISMPSPEAIGVEPRSQ
jgi:signal transduction histidine kinase